MKNIPADINKFGFVEREKHNGRYVKNRCGRDFLYYALHYFNPSEFNAQKNNPEEIEKNGIFGLPVNFLLSWTQLQFIRVPRFLKSKNLTLYINQKEIRNFRQFLRATLKPNKTSFKTAANMIEKIVNSGNSAGIDLSLSFGGLYDHVLFVYGYDEENFYVCDTHKVENLNYYKILEGEKYFMKLPRSEAAKRWGRFSRIWEIRRK